MNNDSTSNDLPRTEAEASTSSTSANGSGDTVEPAQSSQSSQQNAVSAAQKMVLLRIKKKHEFVSNLMTNLDIIIYAELSIVYYMEYAASSPPLFLSLTKSFTVALSSAFSCGCLTRCCSSRPSQTSYLQLLNIVLTSEPSLGPP